MEDKIGAGLLIIVFGLLAAGCFMGGCRVGVDVYRKEAIKRGYGGYETDRETGETNFKWVEPKASATLSDTSEKPNE